MEKIYSRTKTIQEDKVSGFCPGCMHSTVIKLIGEVLDEMNLVDRAASVLGIGCCGLHMDYIAYDTTTAPHGRACAVATGMKRANPDTLVFTYQGDGDFASIGMAEAMGDRLREMPVDTAVAAFTTETPQRTAQILAELFAAQPFDSEFTRGLYYTNN